MYQHTSDSPPQPRPAAPDLRRPPMWAVMLAAAATAGLLAGPLATQAVDLLVGWNAAQPQRAREVLLTEGAALALVRTAGVAAATTLLCVGLGVPYAVLLARTPVPARSVWELLTLVGLVLPSYFSAVGWSSLLGLEGRLTRLLPGEATASSPLYSAAGQAWVLAGTLFPIVPLITAWALRRVRPELEDAARLETGTVGVIWRVSLPAVSVEIASTALLVFALAVGSSAATDLLVVQRLWAGWVFAGFTEHLFDTRAMTMLMLPMPMGLLLVGTGLVIWQRRRADSGGGHLAGPQPRDLPLSPAGRWAGMAYIAGVWAVMVGVPIAAVLTRLVPADGGMLEALAVVLQAWRQAAPALADSVVAAAATGIVSAALALILSASLAQRPKLWPVLMLPLAIPAGLSAAGLITLRTVLPGLGPLLGRDSPIPLPDGTRLVLHTAPLGVIVGLLGRLLPVGLVIVAAGMSRLDPALAEAATVDGASRWRFWRSVLLPLLAPQAVAAGLLVFALALGEIETVTLLAAPGRTYLSAVVYEQAHRNLEHDLAGLCLVQVSLVCVAAVGAWALLRRDQP